jgi:hypothetical protein
MDKSGRAPKVAKMADNYVMVENRQVEPEPSNCSDRPIQSGRE